MTAIEMRLARPRGSHRGAAGGRGTSADHSDRTIQWPPDRGLLARGAGARYRRTMLKSGASNGGTGMGAGIAIGVALGVALDNLGLGIALGVAIGAALGAAQRKRDED